MKKVAIVSLVILLLLLANFVSSSFAEDKITIVVSGQSHASLYPCACPVSPIGGVFRRATAINELRQKEQNLLLLESGGSFAGGSYDTSSLTTELDKSRTEYYMSSLVEMGYDAFLVSNEEFNFGQDYLNEVVSKYKLNYLSLNFKNDKFLPYFIKKVGNVDVAVIGITDERVKSKVETGYNDPKDDLVSLVSKVRKERKAQVVVVLSYLDEKDSESLLQDIKGVDVWVSANNPFIQPSNKKVNDTTLVILGWQVRTLTKLNLTYNQGQLQVDVENAQLVKDIIDNPKMVAITPACFSNSDCRKEGYVGECKNVGTKEAKCLYSEMKPIALTMIVPRRCNTCDTNSALDRIKKIAPNIKVESLFEDSSRAKKLIRSLNIKMLPAYLFNKNSEKEPVFGQIKQIAKKNGDYYVAEPSFVGVSYFTNRKEMSKRLDVFFDIKTTDIIKILDLLKQLKEKRPDIDMHYNFLAIEDPHEGFIAKNGRYEVEEYLRCACIDRYYPDKLQNYLSCRLADVESAWWDDCLVSLGIDSAKIKTCAQSQEGRDSLKGLIKLTQEFEIVFGPTFVINNQEVFGSQGTPTLEELEKLFKE